MKKRTLTFILSLVFLNFVFSQTSTNKVYDLKVIAKSKKDYSISGMDNIGKVNADDPQLTFEVDSEINVFYRRPRTSILFKTSSWRR